MKNILLLSIVSVLFVSDMYAQQATTKSMAASLGLYVFPTKDQTKEVQDADEMACYNWAKEQTGVDPINPPEVQAAAVDTSPDGTAVRGQRLEVQLLEPQLELSPVMPVKEQPLAL
ncbi:MAG: hypothetical protein U5K79_24045 [Cyclobacteriaceae bacterium]|nr:hypothetical protein [Cyclobacteriaceae bacterium]